MTECLPAERFPVLFFGSRDFREPAIVRESMASVVELFGRERLVIIHGGCGWVPGRVPVESADSLAAQAALEMGVEQVPVYAEWLMHGRAAGPIRNQKMMDEWKPVLGLGFCNHQRQKVQETGQPMPCATPRCPEGHPSEYWQAMIWAGPPPPLDRPELKAVMRTVLFKRVELGLGQTNFRCFTWQEIPETTPCPPSSPAKSAPSSAAAPAKKSAPTS